MGYPAYIFINNHSQSCFHNKRAGNELRNAAYNVCKHRLQNAKKCTKWQCVTNSPMGQKAQALKWDQIKRTNTRTAD